jgi:hypothetical protein
MLMHAGNWMSLWGRPIVTALLNRLDDGVREMEKKHWRILG